MDASSSSFLFYFNFSFVIVLLLKLERLHGIIDLRYNPTFIQTKFLHWAKVVYSVTRFQLPTNLVIPANQISRNLSPLQEFCLLLYTYSKVSIKHPVLLTTWFEFFQKVSIKRPGPSQKKSIVLLYFRAATANFWALLNDLVWIFGKKYLLNNQYYLFFQILSA